MTHQNSNVMPIVTGDCNATRNFVVEHRCAGKTVGVVMTMGALHAGHLSLVAASNTECDVTVVTIFVNPTQFGPHEDLEKYPRQLERDIQTLSQLSVDLVFAPSTEQMYGERSTLAVSPTTSVDPAEVANLWDGRYRPGHFRGVATVVLKLFHIVPAHVAYFGTKDFQQLQVIRTMVRDLNVPIRVVGCPTVREADGLAMSSRNAFLSSSQRLQSISLSQGMSHATILFGQGEHDAAKLAECIGQHLVDAGITKIDYVALVDVETLEEVTAADAETVMLIAAYVGETRLIDNRRLGDGPIVAS